MSIETKFIWQNGEFVNWDESVDHTVIHSLHYGSSCFEGIRFYQTDKGPKIFKLDKHIERLLFSAKVLGVESEYSKQDLIDATIELVQKNGIESGYIRPIIYYGYGKMGVNPKGAKVNTVISVWPWGKYIASEAIDVLISDYIRLHPKSAVMEAKLGGYYVNSMLSNGQAINNGFHEALLLDYEGYIAEGSGENIFFVKENKIYTPQLGTILPGITRDTIIEIVKSEFGVELIETKIHPSQLGEFDEAFFTGTAAEVTPIRKIVDREGKDYNFNVILGKKLADYYGDIVTGKNPKYLNRLF